MSAITLHSLDDVLLARLKREAANTGESLNRAAKRLLAVGLGLKPAEPGRHRADFQEFCGVWSAQEQAAFKRNSSGFEKIDPKDWQ